jgi:hypothetical protein
LSMADDLASFDLLRPLLRFRPSNDLRLPTFCRSFSVSPAVAVAVDFRAFFGPFFLETPGPFKFSSDLRGLSKSANFRKIRITQNPLVATPCGFESHHRHHVGVHSARLGKGRRESACLFLICAPWLLLPKSDPLRWAPIWILESGHPTGCPLSDAAPSVRFYPLRSI